MADGEAQDLGRLSVVLPAFNEEANVAEAIRRASAMASRLFADHEIIVVDDGSVDRTAAIVREMAADDSRIRLIQHDRNRGYGAALRSGFKAAKLDLVFLTDSDNQFDVDELDGFLPQMRAVDVVAGYRANRNEAGVRRINAVAWNRLVRMLFHVPLRDVDCAFKLFRRSVLDDLPLECEGAMLSTELMVKLHQAGARVVETPVTHYPRMGGRATGANPKVIMRAFVELARVSRRLTP